MTLDVHLSPEFVQRINVAHEIRVRMPLQFDSDKPMLDAFALTSFRKVRIVPSHSN